jgi:hypothetical protein
MAKVYSTDLGQRIRML